MKEKLRIYVLDLGSLKFRLTVTADIEGLLRIKVLNFKPQVIKQGCKTFNISQHC